MSKVIVVILGSLAAVWPGSAQVFKLTREQMIQYTARNPFDRFPDGRPKVPDSILERVKGLSAEEVFGIERKVPADHRTRHDILNVVVGTDPVVHPPIR
jgi:hypothetical protein